MNRILALSVVVISILFSGCNSSGHRIPVDTSIALEISLQPSATSHPPTSTPIIRPSETPTSPPPSATLTSSPIPLPTKTSTPTATSVPWGSLPLGPENAESVVQRAIWGLGSPDQSAFTADGSLFIQGTPLGVYIYQAIDLQLIRFLPDAREFFLSPVGDLLITRLPGGSILIIGLPGTETLHTLEPIATLTPRMNDQVYAQVPVNRPAMEAMFFDLVTTMTALAVSPDGSQVAIGFGPWTLLAMDDSYANLGIWDLQTGTLVSHLRTNIVRNISQLVFSPNGEKLLSEGQEGEIAVWQVADGQLLWRLPGVGHIVGQPFSPDGSYLALEISTDDDSDVLSWVAVRDAYFGGEQGSQLVGRVASNAISTDNTRLLTTWWGTVSIWSIPHLQLIDTIRTDLDWPTASFSADGRYILLNGGQQAYRVRDLSLVPGYPVPTPRVVPGVDAFALQQMGHISGVLGLRYPQPEQALAWGVSSDSVAWVRELASNTHSFYDFDSPFMEDPDLSFSGDRLAACTDAGLIVITLADGRSSNLGRCRASGVVRFSADGTRIYRSNGILVDVLDSITGELLHNLRGHTYLVEDLMVTQDGAYLVSSSNFQRTLGRELFWWRLDQPARLWNWWANVYQEEYLLGAAFQGDVNVLHTALGGLRSWRLGDGIQHHLDTTRIASLAISPDNRLLASGDYAGVIHLWSLDDWQEVTALSGHLRPVVGLVFSPDGSDLLSTSTDGTIRLWGLP